jgi:hypothetical protein
MEKDEHSENETFHQEGIHDIDLSQDPMEMGAGEDENAPHEPWKALIFYMDKYRIIRKGEGRDPEEEGKAFLAQGERVTLPFTVDVEGSKTPYRLYPVSSTKTINAAVKVLEKDLDKEVRKDSSNRLDEETIRGIITLCDFLFSGACSHPNGNFMLHKTKIVDGERQLSLRPHGRRVWQLAQRLEKYIEMSNELGKRRGKEANLPKSNAIMIVEQELQSSKSRWKIMENPEFRGEDPMSAGDSLESMRENLGFEPTRGAVAARSWGQNTEEEEIIAEETDQRAWIGLSTGGPDVLQFREQTRGNVMSESPKDWIWDFSGDEDPLEYVTNYVCSQAKPCLEEALGLLNHAAIAGPSSNVGSMALTLDAGNKNNPDSYWKIIKRISSRFPSTRPEEHQTAKKLDCARFHLSLDTINRRAGIDTEEFRSAFLDRIHAVLKEDRQANRFLTRNDVLLETLGKIRPEWDAQKRDQWLEELQTFGVGAYENSKAMEANRKRLLSYLNSVFETPRKEFEKTMSDPTKLGETKERLQAVLESATEGFYAYLSGKTGQMTRRELRFKVASIKERADRLGDELLAGKMTEMGRFISGISAQIKSGDWHRNEKANKDTIFRFLLTMLETPKGEGPEFPGSVEPAGKDPLEISVDFLRAFSNEKEFPAGKTTLNNALELFAARQAEESGGKLTSALKKISKSRQESIPVIKNREKSLEGALAILDEVHGETEPEIKLSEKFSRELDLLDVPEAAELTSYRPDPFEDPECPILNADGGLESELPAAIDWLEKKVGGLGTDINADAKELLEMKRCEALATRLLGIASEAGDKEQTSRLMEISATAKRKGDQRLRESWKFWKGVNYLRQNIQSRREPERFQFGGPARGTLQNVIAILNARLAGRKPGEKEQMESKEKLRQFHLTTTRKRTLKNCGAVPMALWLSEAEKGTKKKITHEDLVEKLKERLTACRVCLEISENDSEMEGEIARFRLGMAEDKNALNAFALEQCIYMLEDKEKLAEGLGWINQHPKESKAAFEQGIDNPCLVAERASEILSPNPSGLGSPSPSKGKEEEPAAMAI